MGTSDFSWGKGGRCVRLTTYHPRSAERQENPGALIYPEPLGPPRPVAGDLYLFTSLIVPSHLRLDLPSCLLPSSYEQHLLFCSVHATFPAHVILLKISDVVWNIKLPITQYSSVTSYCLSRRNTYTSSPYWLHERMELSRRSETVISGENRSWQLLLLVSLCGDSLVGWPSESSRLETSIFGFLFVFDRASSM